MLMVEDFFGTYQISTLDELERILDRRSESICANAYSLSPAQTAFPFLGIFVKNDQAILNYIASEGGDCAISRGAEAYGNAVFYENSAGATIVAPAEAIVPVATAVEAAREFFETHTSPSCVRWLAI